MSLRLSDDDFLDLVASTTADLGKGYFDEFATELQQYPAMRILLRKERIKKKSGKGISRNVLTKDDGGAHATHLYAGVTPNKQEGLESTYEPWSHHRNDWSVDRREIAMNDGDEEIVDLHKTNRVQCFLSMAAHLETQVWNAPADSDAKLDVKGFPYWICAGTGETFAGGDPSGFANGAGGLKSADFPYWQNWAGTYNEISERDAVLKMRKAFMMCNWVPPIDIPAYRRASGMRYMLFAGIDFQLDYATLAKNQNDNVGGDLAHYDGDLVLNRHRIVYVPYLDGVASKPIFMVDMNRFYINVLGGEYLRESKPYISGAQGSAVATTDVDLTFQMDTAARRNHARLDLAA